MPSVSARTPSHRNQRWPKPKEDTTLGEWGGAWFGLWALIPYALGQCPHPERLLDINVQRLRGGLVFQVHRRLYHPTLGLRVIQKKNKKTRTSLGFGPHSRDASQVLPVDTNLAWTRLLPLPGGNTSNGFKDVHLKTTVRIWSRLSYKRQNLATTVLNVP